MSSPTSQATPFQRAYDNFTVSLTAEERNRFRFASLDDLRRALDDIQREQAAKRKMMNLGRLSAFLEAMAQFEQVVKVFLNTSSFVAFVWGPMKFLLQTASTFVDSFEALLSVYEELGEQLPQFKDYEELFGSDARVRDILAWIYTDILDFHKRALKVFSRRVWEHLFSATWKTYNTRFQGILNNLKRHKALLEQQGNLAHFHEFQLASQRAEREYHDMEEKERHKQLAAVTNWLARANSHLDQADAVKERENQAGSGRWLLDRAEVKTWLDSSRLDVEVLWIRGIPGAGKSILASVIVEAVRKDSSIALGYFYCKYQHTHKSTTAAIARELLLQFLQRDPDLLPLLYDKLCRNGECLLESPAAVKELSETVFRSAGTAYLVIDGIDECDAAERKKTLAWITSSVAAVNSGGSGGGLRALFVSQNLADIRRQLGTATIVTLNAQDTKADINAYVSYWAGVVQQKFKLKDGAPPEMVAAVTARANGMFLYAKLVMQNLLHQVNLAGVRKELSQGSLPEGIDQAYQRIVARIFSNPRAAEKEAATKLLGWIVTAKRPLKWFEIQGAMAIDLEERTVDYDGRRLHVDLNELCGSLVETRSEGVIELVHSTAWHYLTSKDQYIRLSSEEPQLAMLCMKYLSFDCFSPSLAELEIRRQIIDACYIFQDYAAAHWLSHFEASVRLLQPDDPTFADVVRAADDFLRVYWQGPTARARPPQAIQKKFEALKSPHVSKYTADDFYNRVLQVACFSSQVTSPRTGEPLVVEDPLRLCETVQRIRSVFEALAQSLPPPAPTSREAAPVTVTAAAPTRSDAEAVCSAYGPPCAWFRCPRPTCVRFYDGYSTAARRDRHETDHVRPYRCKTEDCSTDVLGFNNRAALTRHMAVYHPDDDGDLFPAAKKAPADPLEAARLGDCAALTRMLAKGADVNVKARYSRTLLHVVAIHGHVDFARLLVDSGKFDINAADKYRNTPLWYAAEKGSVDMVALLLAQESVRADCECAFATTPFWKAADMGRGAVVRLLRQRSDVDETKADKWGQNALGRAAAGGHEDVMRLLLSSRFSRFSHRGAALGQALTLAAAAGQHYLVNVLLNEYGAEARVAEFMGVTAVGAAAARGHEAVVELLLRNGADTQSRELLVWRSNKHPETYRNWWVMDFILRTDGLWSKHADVALKPHLTRTDAGSFVSHASARWSPLSVAVQNNHEGVVKLLLAHSKAGLNEQLENGQAPLALAVYSGVAMVRLLLAQQEVNVNGSGGQPPLYVAASLGYDQIVQLLLEQKAINVNAAGPEGATALHEAATIGHTAILEQLLERGADVNRGKDGCITALMLATAAGNYAVAKLLLEHGADVQAANLRGETAIKIAYNMGRHEMFNLLKRYAQEMYGIHI